MAEEALRRTPLYETHRGIGARLVPFAGWEMPVQYSGILEEARAVRGGVGLFDISHMGRFEIGGPGALALLQRTTSNDVAALTPGQAQYSLLTNPRGGIIDDIIVYRMGETQFRVVVNASNTEKDWNWLAQQCEGEVDKIDRTAATAMIAVQGPQAPTLIASLADREILGLSRFAYAEGRLAGIPATFCRTGYTGEDGFEIIVGAEEAAALWRTLQQAGGVPCGLGARDALRIEAGYPLYGHEIDDTTTPVEAGLMWVVKPEKGDFIGRSAILERKQQGPDRRLVGILLKERLVPRQGYTLLVEMETVGVVTSGVFSPMRNIGLGMAYVQVPYHKSGTEVQVQIRNNLYPATVVPKKSLLEG